MNPPTAIVQLRPNLGNTRHHLIVGATDSISVMKPRHN
jgi:hypothetical protein